MKMKRKLIAPLIALFLCISMIGIGFAGWVITASKPGAASGNFTVYSVTDNRYDFTANTNASVVFGYGDAPNNNKGWLTYNTDSNKGTVVNAAALTPTFTLTSAVNVNAGDVVTYEVGTIQLTDTNSNYATAVAKGFIADLPNISGTYTFTIPAEGSSVTIKKDGADTTGVTATWANNTLTVTFQNATFAWGSITNGQNPYTFFNTYGANDTYSFPGQTAPTEEVYDENKTYADIALLMLEGISELSSVGYSVSVTGSRNAAAN